MNSELGEKQKLNIAFVCDAVTDCVAGSFISTQQFSERLAERGHKVIYIAAKSRRFPGHTQHGNIKAYRFRSFLVPKSEGQLYLSFPRASELQKIFVDEKIDIVHNIIPMPSAIAATKAATTLGIKIVSHSHTQPENIFMHLPQGPWVAVINRLFYRYMSWLYGEGHALIYPTEYAQQLMTAIHTDITPLVISNGVDTKRFAPVPTNDLFEKFNLPRHTVNILYAGRLHPEKSIDTLIKAMPLVLTNNPDTHLFLAGFGHLDTKLMKLAHDLKVAAHITFLGRVSDEEMVMAQHAADIFVLPSLAELEGMVVLEAMAAGKPIVVANSKESASTYFVNDNGFLFEPENEADLAEKLGRLIADPALRKRMGELSLEKSKEYDIAASVDQLESLYYSLLNH